MNKVVSTVGILGLIGASLVSCEKDPLNEDVFIPQPEVVKEVKQEDPVDTLSEWSAWSPEFDFQSVMEQRFTGRQYQTVDEMRDSLRAPFIQTRTRNIVVNGVMDSIAPVGDLEETRALQINMDIETVVELESDLNPPTDINNDGDLIDEVTYEITTFSYINEIYRLGGGIDILNDLTEIVEVESPVAYISSLESETIPSSIGCDGSVVELRNDGNYYPVCNAIYLTIHYSENIDWSADIIEQIDGTHGNTNSFARFIEVNDDEDDVYYDEYTKLYYKTFVLEVDDNWSGYGRHIRITFSGNGIQHTITLSQDGN